MKFKPIHQLCFSVVIAVLMLLLVVIGCDSAQKRTDKGIIYEQVAATAPCPWSPRYGHTTVAFKDRIWVLGGTDTTPPKADVLFNLKSDVWSSADGVNWTLATAAAPWAGRCLHNSLVFDNKIWVFGGLTRYAPNPTKKQKVNANDVWCSEDGVNWTQITEAADWEARHVFTSVVHNNRMWVIGGAGKKIYNDVWSSEDGLNWTKAEGCTERFEPRTNHTIASFKGKIWLFGGLAHIRGDLKNKYPAGDVWSSADGVNWKQVTVMAPWSTREFAGVVVYRDELWLTGGRVDKLRGTWANDMWHSPDGIKWIKERAAIWPPGLLMPVTFGDSVWILGGRRGKENLNDVWRFSWR